MKTVGIAIDGWKLDIFDKHLKAAGYTYEVVKMATGMLILKVKSETVSEMQPLIERAQKECRGAGNGTKH